MPRIFRLRMRPGRALISFSDDPNVQVPPSPGDGEEILASEAIAGSLVKQRAAEIVEVIEEPSGTESPLYE